MRLCNLQQSGITFTSSIVDFVLAFRLLSNIHLWISLTCTMYMLCMFTKMQIFILLAESHHKSIVWHWSWDCVLKAKTAELLRHITNCRHEVGWYALDWWLVDQRTLWRQVLVLYVDSLVVLCRRFNGCVIMVDETVADEGSLLTCCECPASYHAECVKSSRFKTSAWRCPNCCVGRKPLYGEIVWAKFGTYRWVSRYFNISFYSTSAVLAVVSSQLMLPEWLIAIWNFVSRHNVDYLIDGLLSVISTVSWPGSAPFCVDLPDLCRNDLVDTVCDVIAWNLAIDY